VDFCFKDGAPLEAEDQTVPAPSGSGSYALGAPSSDELDAPDAVSLSGISAVGWDHDDDTAAQTLPGDLPDAEEFDRTFGGLSPVGDLEPDITGPIDPFGGHEEEAFRSRLEEAPRARGTAAAADEDVDETQVDDEPTTEPLTPRAKTPPRSKRATMASPSSREPAASSEDGGKGLSLFLGVAAVLVIGFFGVRAMTGPDSSPQPPPTTAVRMPAAPEPEQPAPTAADEPETPEEAVAALEGGSGEEPGESGDDPSGLEESIVGEDPAAGEEDPETPASAVEESTPSARELQARQDARREREARRREQRERRIAEAARRDASSDSPEPPFSAGETDATTPAAAAPAPRVESTPAPGASPWGTTAQTESQVTISSSPPGARVTVGGRYRGQAPVSMTLPAGTHEVRVEQQGHATQTRYVRVAGSAVSLDVVLELLARIAQGTVLVASSPPAMLFVDGVAKGKTPVSVAIAAGSHTFRLDAEGQDSFTQTVDIQLSDGETINRFFKLP
jgi:hypothetical protein